jgi:shikimate dehydrogenase
MKFALIGNPVSKSISPELHKVLYKELDIKNCFLSKVQLAESELDSFFDKINTSYNGLNVTIPFKNEVISYLDELDKEAKILNNVNCISIKEGVLKGYNTDKYGFDMLCARNAIVIENRKCMVLGAGSSAKTVVKSLIDSGAREIIIKNKSENNALKVKEFAKKLGFTNIALFSNQQSSCELIINTTPLGMYSTQDKDNFFDMNVNNNTDLIDLVYISKSTMFLNKFETNGKKVNGLDMLIFQALKSIEIWNETTYNVNSKIDSIIKQLEKIIC